MKGPFCVMNGSVAWLRDRLNSGRESFSRFFSSLFLKLFYLLRLSVSAKLRLVLALTSKSSLVPQPSKIQGPSKFVLFSTGMK